MLSREDVDCIFEQCEVCYGDMQRLLNIPEESNDLQEELRMRSS